MPRGDVRTKPKPGIRVEDQLPISELVRRSKLSIAALYPHGVRALAKRLDYMLNEEPQPIDTTDAKWLVEMHDGKPRQPLSGDRSNPLVVEHVLRPLPEIDAEIAALEAMRGRLRVLPPGQVIEGEARALGPGPGARKTRAKRRKGTG